MKTKQNRLQALVLVVAFALSSSPVLAASDASTRSWPETIWYYATQPINIVYAGCAVVLAKATGWLISPTVNKPTYPATTVTKPQVLDERKQRSEEKGDGSAAAAACGNRDNSGLNVAKVIMSVGAQTRSLASQIDEKVRQLNDARKQGDAAVKKAMAELDALVPVTLPADSDARSAVCKAALALNSASKDKTLPVLTRAEAARMKGSFDRI